ncbi:glycosyltransferase family 4 protein [Baekduia soli]|uniref:Glycosyltransferase family 4 protein n=1 Tax=Baekduia soli TaxID=496014 RepID=A0A5B8TZW1_9ACTN|nr:glycosyltransferase family 1 protein [Baekduia soli]QEC46263.1 glycosyltransferase family 4 protein [Baekduia soli]
MRVAINALFLAPPMGGVETYLRELCRALLAGPDAPQLTVLLNPAGHDKLTAEDWAAGAELVRCEQLGRGGLRALSELTAIGAVADRRRADVVHSVAMTGPLVSRAARVVTIPDTVWITHPEDVLTHRLWRTVVPWVARRADRVVAISHAAGEELRTHLGVPARRLDVIPLGFGSPAVVDPTREADLRAGLGLGPGPIVLNVGQKKPHRNLERLVAAMAGVRAAVPGAQLVLPGPPNAEAEAALRALAAREGVGGAVVVPGFLSQADLEGLYAAAAAFVLPSLVEGFGLPVLEAMARGLPVACSRGSAPGEVAGDAGLLLDPTSQDEIRDATVRLLTDPALHARLAAAGRARAASFTWERCAAQTLDVYRRAAAR